MEEIRTDNTEPLKNALERIAELEKENAELKEKLKPENCLKLLAKEGYIKFTSDQLTKSKNILNNFLNACEDYEISEARAEAEQFLKEETE